MKGDFSRETFDPDKHYTAVLMQQGRVQLDADWNEQQALNQYRDETEATDVIGAAGGPKDDAGFEITTDGKTLFIGKGRYYVDGILCQNDVEKQPYEGQDEGDLPGATMRAVLEALKKQNATSGIVYLDVWKRHVTYLEDGLLLEKALGEPDTTTRVQTVWQVRVLPVPPRGRRDVLTALARRREAALAQLEAAKGVVAAVDDQITAVRLRLDAFPPGARQRLPLERRLAELTDQETAASEAASAAKAELDQVNREIAKASLAGALSCDDSPQEWDDLPRLGTGLLNARTQAPANQNNPCLPPPGTGYRRLENQLYRVEIHEPGPSGTATFKWSRDNGTVVTAIESISGNTIVVHDLGRDEMLGFKAGDWVEITDDVLELNGRPGQLAQINPPNEATRQITLLNATPTPLAPGPGGVDKSRHPKLRRWDQLTQVSAPADEHGIATSGTFLPLEDGVEVQFGPGAYRTGDYWLIPARTAIGDIEWPPYAVPNIAPQPQPARGIEHHYCRLAVLEVADGELKVTGDCRSIFCPLTEVQCTGAAIHVTATSWINDDLVKFADDGSFELRTTVDVAPDPRSVHEASVIVTAEIPYTSGREQATPQPGVFETIIIEGAVSIDASDSRVIVWRYQPPATGIAGPQVMRLASIPLGAEHAPAEPARRGARARAAAAATDRAVSRPTNLPRLRVTLKGHVIWSTAERTGERRYLDGQAFGVPSVRSDRRTPRTALTFPTGSGARASDFESWMYVGQNQDPPEAFKVTTVTFRTANEQVSSAGVVQPPVAALKAVSFKAGEQVRFVDIAFNRPTVTIDQPPGAIQSVIVTKIGSSAVTVRIPGQVLQKDEKTIRFIALEPPAFGEGTYVVTALGDAGAVRGAAPIQAADDKTRLDGNFDGTEGGNFTLQFSAV